MPQDLLLNGVFIEGPFGSGIQPGRPSVKQSQDFTFSWKNVCVSCKLLSPLRHKLWRNSHRAERKEIIQNVSGTCKTGQLLAILGPSGAGKTTLLNALTGRNTGSLTITGELSLNGQRVTASSLTAISAYVQQADLFISTLTPRELLLFHLGLTGCAENVIGGATMGSGLSGGERKRLSIGCEMITDPDILFCDEPTSGLDSFMAKSVVEIMKNMVQQGRLVIATIHQPNSEVFEMFDKIMFLAEGRTAYLGDGKDAVLSFLKEVCWPCPKDYNPAEHLIDLISIEPEKEIFHTKRMNSICDAFAASDENISIMQELEPQFRSQRNFYEDKSHISREATWFCQLRLLCWRTYLEIVREPFLIKARCIQLLAISFLLGILYMNQMINDVGVFNVNGLLFLVTTNLTFQNVKLVITGICGERAIFLREYHNGMYRVDTYFIARNIVEFPLVVVYTSLYVSFFYYMAGLGSSFTHFLTFYLIANLISWASVSFGYLLSCVTGSLKIALTLIAPVVVPLLVLGGFLINVRSLVWFLRWLTNISWFSYAFELLLINQWGDVRNITCTHNKKCYGDGIGIIEDYNFNLGNMNYDIVGLILLGFAFRAIALLLLYIRTKVARKSG